MFQSISYMKILNQEINTESFITNINKTFLDNVRVSICTRARVSIRERIGYLKSRTYVILNDQSSLFRDST
jgi:hypothetical protein